MKILVLGGAGFIGSRIVRTLLARADEDDHIVVVDDLSTGSRENLEGTHPDVEFHQADATYASNLFDPGTFDAVYHLASPASPDVFVSQWDDIVRANIGGAMAAASLLRKGGLLVLASSSEVYGQPAGAMDENCLGAVRTQSVRGVYDESKRLAESIVYSACQREGVRGLILRIFNTYGPGMPDDGRVINTFVRQARAGEALTVHGDGDQSRSFCYVDDTVSQIIALVDWAETHTRDGDCEVFNVGNPSERSIMEAAQIVAGVQSTLSGKATPIQCVPSTRPDDPVWRCPVTTRTVRAIGDRALVSLEEGVRRCF